MSGQIVIPPRGLKRAKNRRLYVIFKSCLELLECGAPAILRYLHSIEGALCFGDRGLAITYAEQRIRSEKNALGTEEIKHQLENFWCMIEYSRVAIEFLEMIDEWLYYFGRRPHSPFVKSRPSTYQPRSATALCYGPDQGG